MAPPLLFALHVAEEAPGFVAWFNAHVEPDITTANFWAINTAGMVITLVFAALAALAPRNRAAVLAATAWLGFLMLANGILHLAATILDGVYVPGVVTALLLYLPMSALWIAAAARELSLTPARVSAVALVGGLPMYVHGYLVLVEGVRLV